MSIRAHRPLDTEKVELHPNQNPKAIDLTPRGDIAGPLKGKTYPGIYKIERDTLTLCLFITEGSKRPTRFATKGTYWVLDVYKRAKPSSPLGPISTHQEISAVGREREAAELVVLPLGLDLFRSS